MAEQQNDNLDDLPNEARAGRAAAKAYSCMISCIGPLVISIQSLLCLFLIPISHEFLVNNEYVMIIFCL